MKKLPLYRFSVKGIDGQPRLPKSFKPSRIEQRGRNFEVLVDEREAKYLRERSYAQEIPLPRDHLSVSQINMFKNCPRQYYYAYVMGMRRKPNSNLTFGSAFHSTAEVNYKQKIESYEDLPVGDVQEIWVNEFDKRIPETVFEEGEKPGAIKDEGVAAVEVYMKTFAPKIQPFMVEAEIDVPLEDVEFSIRCRVDVVDIQSGIHDTKTSSKTPAFDLAEDDFQLTSYDIAHRHILGIPPTKLYLDYLVRTKIPKVVALESDPRTDKQIDEALKEFSQVARAIRDGAYYRCSPRNSLCNPRYCGFYPICRGE